MYQYIWDLKYTFFQNITIAKLTGSHLVCYEPLIEWIITQSLCIFVSQGLMGNKCCITELSNPD